MKRRPIVLIALLAAGGLSMVVARAQQDPAAIRIEKVKNNLYVIAGGRGPGQQAGSVSGNTTVFIANSGVVLVDTEYPGYGQVILDTIKSVTTKPVTMVINTHTHGDHTGGNNGLPRTVEFVAHENTKTNMAKMEAFKGEGAAFLPKRIFKDKMSLLGGDDRIDLYYFGAGHTNGDAVIVFPALGTAVMGDLFARKWAPLVDANNGGSAVAFADTLEKALAGIMNVDTIIPGHAPVQSWNDLKEFTAYYRGFLTTVVEGMKTGKSVEEVAKAYTLPDRYKRMGYTSDAERVRNTVEMIFTELRK